MTSTTSPFRLLDLPLELVLEVCAYAVTLPGPICLHSIAPVNSFAEKEARSAHPAPAQHASRISEPPLSRVNKFLRVEALPLFYRLNDFHGVNWSEPRPDGWLKRVSRENRQAMRGLFVNSSWSARDLASWFKAVGLGSGVRVESVEGDGRVRERLCFEARGRTLYLVKLA